MAQNKPKSIGELARAGELKYVLVAGTPWDGMTIYGRADGGLFDSEEEAEKAFELDDRIGSDAWEVVPVVPTYDSSKKPDYCTVGCTGPWHRDDCALAGQTRY